MKLRAAVKKGKAIEKQRADLEAQLSALREQVLHLCHCKYYSSATHPPALQGSHSPAGFSITYPVTSTRSA